MKVMFSMPFVRVCVCLCLSAGLLKK